MQRYLQALEQRLLFYGRRAGIKVFAGLIAAVMVCIGLGFVVYGIWIAMALNYGPIIASLALGGGFVLLGLIVFWGGTLHKRTPPPVPPPAYSSPQSASIVALVEAFVLGMKAGRDKGQGPKDET